MYDMPAITEDSQPANNSQTHYYNPVMPPFQRKSSLCDEDRSPSNKEQLGRTVSDRGVTLKLSERQTFFVKRLEKGCALSMPLWCHK